MNENGGEDGKKSEENEIVVNERLKTRKLKEETDL